QHLTIRSRPANALHRLLHPCRTRSFSQCWLKLLGDGLLQVLTTHRPPAAASRLTRPAYVIVMPAPMPLSMTPRHRSTAFAAPHQTIEQPLLFTMQRAPLAGTS